MDSVSTNGIHLNLALENSIEVQKIDYTLESPNNVVLLTGANSGGKTTLLETIAQICIMSQMGLPVCASKARVKIVDEVYFFSKKRSLDAGAFESFLRTFMPIVTLDTDKLILLDELEAITELEAAVKIISSFMDFISDSNSLAVIVTDMAREILKYTDVRVDGVEAKGLDEQYVLCFFFFFFFFFFVFVVVVCLCVLLVEHIVQVHGIDAIEKVVVRRQLRRGQLMKFFEALRRALSAWKRAPRRIIGRVS